MALLLICRSGITYSETYYFHNDHLGTPQALTDKDQYVVWQAEYDPFGKATETVATVEQNLRFQGQYLDRESGLHYNYYRTYDPATGRYTQSDPIGLGGGINTYGYAYQNSLIYTDPTGEIAFIPIIIGVVAGVAFDYALETYKESKECSCEDSVISTAGNIAIGTSFGFFGPFDKKPRTGIAGGGPSGNKTSIFSHINHASAAKGLYSKTNRNLMTKAGRSVPYAGSALAAYQIYNAATCE